MNVYERSYKRVRADGLSQPDLIETLRADGVFRAFAPLQQPLVEELVAQHFHGYITVQKLVVGQKDFGHTAIANRTNNLIASVQDGLAIFIHYSFPPPA